MGRMIRSHSLVAIAASLFCLQSPRLCVWASVIGTNQLQPIKDLPPESRIRRSASGVGKLLITADSSPWICTAALISPSYVLTAGHCALDGATGGTFILGNIDKETPGRSYRINPQPVEGSPNDRYAIFSVEGNPSAEFEPATLLVRDPEKDEAAYILQHPGGEPLAVASDCKVIGLDEAEGLINHDCDTQGGSSGALLFSKRDNAVLGVHARGAMRGTAEYNVAVSMGSIASESPIVAAVAWVRQGTRTAQLDPSVDTRNQPIGTVPLAQDTSIAFADSPPFSVTGQSKLVVNGKSVEMARAQSRNAYTVLSGGDVLRQGLNYIQTAADTFAYWNEDRMLTRFAQPYASTYAIIAAVDDYGRTKDSAHRGPIKGYEPLQHMVDRARELESTLITIGVPRANILRFYDQDATSSNLEGALKRFWTGHDLAGTSRLIFYFGGHGMSTSEKEGILVTYDFDSGQPTTSGFLMADFMTRYFSYTQVHHFLVLLDSCSSGLATGTRVLGEIADEKALERFSTLANIRADTDPAARNILVAGTGDQRALYKTGGIFTKALIQGLKGSADYNRDGVIQFAELAMYVTSQVRAEASRVGVRQDPREFIADLYGNGKVLFLTRPLK